MELNPKAAAIGAGLAALILYVACLVIIAVMPLQMTVVAANSLFHGIDVSSIAVKDTGILGNILGAVLWPVIAAGSAYLFAAIYNLAKRRT